MNTTYDSISVERVAQTEWITLQRTKQMNALSSQMLDETANALDVAMQDDTVRVVAITGSGRAFAPGPT